LPELPEKKLQKFRDEYHLSDELAGIMIRSLRIDLFEQIVTRHPELAVTVASALETTWRNLEREGVNVEDIPEEQIILLFDRLATEQFAKEAIEELLTYLAQHPEKTVDNAVEDLGLGVISRAEIKGIIDQIVKANATMVAERGERALGPLMGLVMKEVRGRVDGKLVSELLQKAVKAQMKS
jgi:glutamyl-tRNA(Gln) amidotransferase subunit E